MYKTRRRQRQYRLRSRTQKGGTKPYVALDCEMVGIGRKSVLAEVAIVDYDGNLLYHAYVKPPAGQTVTDYRTSFSGITEEHLKSGKSFYKVQDDVLRIAKGKILVGHALENDLKALQLEINPEYVRNTAHTQMFQSYNKYGRFQPQSLKSLTEKYLGKKIQEGSHDPAEDARSAMALFRMFETSWNSKQIGPTMIKPEFRVVKPVEN